MLQPWVTLPCSRVATVCAPVFVLSDASLQMHTISDRKMNSFVITFPSYLICNEILHGHWKSVGFSIHHLHSYPRLMLINPDNQQPDQKRWQCSQLFSEGWSCGCFSSPMPTKSESAKLASSPVFISNLWLSIPWKINPKLCNLMWASSRAYAT